MTTYILLCPECETDKDLKWEETTKEGIYFSCDRCEIRVPLADLMFCELGKETYLGYKAANET